jgi:hypothetical protein
MKFLAEGAIFSITLGLLFVAGGAGAKSERIDRD